MASEANLAARPVVERWRAPVGVQTCKMAGSYAAVYLHDEGAREGAPTRCQSARRHLAVVLLRRQDRRARLQRRRQELAAEDHGRRRHELHRRSVSRRGHLDRLPAAGAAARSGEDRARQRRGGRRRRQGAADALRRDERQARRRSVAGGDGEGARRTGQAPGQDRRVERLGPRLAARNRHGRAAPAAGGCRRDEALRRRTPPRRAVPAAAAVARSAAARRADQPPRCRVRRLARAVSQGLRGDRRRRDARSLLPRQRRRLDSGARSRPRHPVGRQLLVLAGAEAEPAAAGREGRNPQRSGRSSASSNGSGCRRARGRPKARRGSNAYEKLLREDTAKKIETAEIYIPPGPRLGDVVVEARGVEEGLRRQPAHRRTRSSRCRAAASSASSARTAPARRRCSG